MTDPNTFHADTPPDTPPENTGNNAPNNISKRWRIVGMTVTRQDVNAALTALSAEEIDTLLATYPPSAKLLQEMRDILDKSENPADFLSQIIESLKKYTAKDGSTPFADIAERAQQQGLLIGLVNTMFSYKGGEGNPNNTAEEKIDSILDVTFTPEVQEEIKKNLLQAIGSGQSVDDFLEHIQDSLQACDARVLSFLPSSESDEKAKSAFLKNIFNKISLTDKDAPKIIESLPLTKNAAQKLVSILDEKYISNEMQMKALGNIEIDGKKPFLLLSLLCCDIQLNFPLLFLLHQKAHSVASTASPEDESPHTVSAKTQQPQPVKKNEQEETSLFPGYPVVLPTPPVESFLEGDDANSQDEKPSVLDIIKSKTTLAAQKLFAFVGTGIQKATPAMRVGASLLGAAFTGTKNHLADPESITRKTFTGVKNHLADPESATRNILRDTFRGAGNQITNPQSVTRTIYGGLKNIVRGTGSAIRNSWDIIKDTASGVYTVTKDTVRGLWSASKTVGAHAHKPLNAIGRGIAGGAKGLWAASKFTAKSITSPIWFPLLIASNFAKGTFNAAGKLLGGTKDLITSFLMFATSPFLGFGFSTKEELRKYAKHMGPGSKK